MRFLRALTAKVVGDSNIPTNNRLLLGSGEKRYVHCAADIFLTGLYQMDVQGTASCPVCGTTIHVRMTNGKITSLQPTHALLHYVMFPERDPSRFGIQCDKTFLFDEKRCLESWKKSYRGSPGKVVSPKDFLAIFSPVRQSEN